MVIRDAVSVEWSLRIYHITYSRVLPQMMEWWKDERVVVIGSRRIYEWRTNELKELTDKFLKSIDEELGKLNKKLLENES